MAKTTLKLSDLQNIAQGAEITSQQAKEKEKRIVQRRERKYKKSNNKVNITFTVTEEQREKIFNYLDENQIKSLTLLITQLLTEKGIFENE
jgi:hypothetical protein